MRRGQTPRTPSVGSVLQGEGGDAIGGVLGERAAKMAALHTAATSAAAGGLNVSCHLWLVSGLWSHVPAPVPASLSAG